MQEGYVYSRRAMLLAPAYGHGESSAAAAAGASQVMAGQEAPAGGSGGDVVAGPAGTSSFDANVVMILAVLLCALICALGLNSIVRCALRCSSGGRMMMSSSSSAAAGDDGELGPSAAAAAAQAAGVRRKALRAMPTMVYSAATRLHAPSPACAICLAELEPGERVRVLPKCNHGFHVRCVDRWLLARSTCPTCRQPLFAAPAKASGCDGGGGGAAAAGAAPARPFLVPLRPEGFVTPYDF